MEIPQHLYFLGEEGAFFELSDGELLLIPLKTVETWMTRCLAGSVSCSCSSPSICGYMGAHKVLWGKRKKGSMKSLVFLALLKDKLLSLSVPESCLGVKFLVLPPG